MLQSEPAPAQDIRKTDESVAVLGYTVFWRVGGVQISHAILSQALSYAGWWQYLPALPQPATALRRALLKYAHNAVSETVLLRSISRTPCVLALVKEENHRQGGSLSYNTVLRVRYDPTTQDICATRSSQGPIDAATEDVNVSTALRPLFQKARETHTGEDLSRVLRALVASFQSVRLQRGVYFVPAAIRTPLQQLDRLITQLPGSPLLITLAQLDQRGTREKLVHAIHADFVRDLAAEETKMRELFASPTPPEVGILSQQLVRCRAIQNKARIYADLLGTRAQEIGTRLDALQGRVQQLLLIDLD